MPKSWIRSLTSSQPKLTTSRDRLQIPTLRGYRSCNLDCLTRSNDHSALTRPRPGDDIRARRQPNYLIRRGLRRDARETLQCRVRVGRRMGGFEALAGSAALLVLRGQGAVDLRLGSRPDRDRVRLCAARNLCAPGRAAKSRLPGAQRLLRGARRARGGTTRGGGGHDEPPCLGTLSRNRLRGGLPEELGPAAQALRRSVF